MNFFLDNFEKDENETKKRIKKDNIKKDNLKKEKNINTNHEINKVKKESKINIKRNLSFWTNKPSFNDDDKFFVKKNTKNDVKKNNNSKNENEVEQKDDIKNENETKKNDKKNNKKSKNKNKKSNNNLKNNDNYNELKNSYKNSYKNNKNFKFKNKGAGLKFNIKQKYSDKVKNNAYKKKYMYNGNPKSMYYSNIDDKEDDNLINDRFKVKIKDISEKNIITKDNIYFELMNKSLKLLLLNKNNLDEKNNNKLDEVISKFYLNPLFNYKELFENKENMDLVLEEFGFKELFKFQIDGIKILNEHKKCFLNIFTGGGKSFLFQINPLINKNLTIVISPFISINLDQIKKIPKNIPSCIINSWLNSNQKFQILNLIKDDKIRILIITPEMFISEVGIFLINNKIKIDTICIDEAHCSSIYSHNFRPSYLIIHKLINKLQKNLNDELKLLFLSATTNISIWNYIKSLYEIKDEMIIKSDITFRENLKLHFIESDNYNKDKDLMDFIDKNENEKKPVWIYCNFNISSEIISNMLKQNFYKSEYFHMDLTDIQKMNILTDFLNSNITKNEYNSKESFREINIIVSTLSLSMGLDHPNIRGIYHYNIPSNLETYIQQIGRAGRDGLISYCKLFLNTNDFYFVKNKLISDYLISNNQLGNIVNFLLKKDYSFLYKKNNKRSILKGDKYFYIKKSKIKDELNLDYNFFIRILVFIKNITSEFDINLNYNFNCSYLGNMLIDKNNEFFNHEYYKSIKKVEKKNGKLIKFNIIKVCNILKKDPFEFILDMKKISEEYDFTFYALDSAIYFDITMEKKNLNDDIINQIVKKTKIKIMENLKILSLKVEILYGLIRYCIINKNNENIKEKFIHYINLYFKNNEKDMIEILKKEINYLDLVRLIYIDNKELFNKFILDEYWDYISEYYEVF